MTMSTNPSNDHDLKPSEHSKNVDPDGVSGSSPGRMPQSVSMHDMTSSARPPTRSRTARTAANQSNASKRMSTRASSGGDVVPVDTGAFNDR